MTDHIRVRGIRAEGTHGVLPAEHRRPQSFVVDVDLRVDLAPAGASDALADTIDYGQVGADVVGVVHGPHVDLIEHLAERIAARCLHRQGVQGVTVTVHKPAAPLDYPFADVAVTIDRARWRPAVLALGANRGDILATFTSAVRAVAAIEGLALRTVSRLVDTDPVGVTDQAPYLNAVALLDTVLHPRTLLARLAEIEDAHGRVRTRRWGARTLDLDLIQVGDPARGTDLECDEDHLTLPHPRTHARAFVLVPWLQVDPGATLRVDGAPVPVADLLARQAQDGESDGLRPGPDWEPTW